MAPSTSGGRVEGRRVLVAHPGAELYGSDRMVLESVAGLVDRGWRVTVALASSGPLVGELEACGGEVRVVAAPVLRKAYRSPSGLIRLAVRSVASLAPCVRLLRELRPEVVYVSTVTIPTWIVLARLLGVPVVCHVHEAEASQSALVRRTLSLPLLLAQRLAVNSRFSMGVVVGDWPPLARRFSVVRNGVVGPDHPSAPRPALEPPLRLLYVGRLSERKGVLDAVEALVILRRRDVDAELDVVGDTFPGHEWVVRELVDRAVRTGISDRVHLHGFDADIWPYLARADVLLVPSRVDEPFGNVVVEGALAARPSVVSRSGGLTEAADGLAGVRLVDPGRPDQIADAVTALAAQWAEVSAAAVADRPGVVDRYSLARYREAVADLVGSCARSGVSRPAR